MNHCPVVESDVRVVPGRVRIVLRPSSIRVLSGEQIVEALEERVLVEIVPVAPKILAKKIICMVVPELSIVDRSRAAVRSVMSMFFGQPPSPFW